MKFYFFYWKTEKKQRKKNYVFESELRVELKSRKTKSQSNSKSRSAKLIVFDLWDLTHELLLPGRLWSRLGWSEPPRGIVCRVGFEFTSSNLKLCSLFFYHFKFKIWKKFLTEPHYFSGSQSMKFSNIDGGQLLDGWRSFTDSGGKCRLVSASNLIIIYALYFC